MSSPARGQHRLFDGGHRDTGRHVVERAGGLRAPGDLQRAVTSNSAARSRSPSPTRMKALSSARAAHRALGAAHELEPARRAHRVGAGAVLARRSRRPASRRPGRRGHRPAGRRRRGSDRAGRRSRRAARRSPRRSATARGRRRRGRRRGARSARSRRRGPLRPPRRSPGAARRAVRRPASAPAGRAGPPAATSPRATRSSSAWETATSRAGRSGNESRSRYTPGVSAAAPRGPPGPRARPSARRRPCSPASSRRSRCPRSGPCRRRGAATARTSSARPGRRAPTGQPRVQRLLRPVLLDVVDRQARLIADEDGEVLEHLRAALVGGQLRPRCVRGAADEAEQHAERAVGRRVVEDRVRGPDVGDALPAEPGVAPERGGRRRPRPWSGSRARGPCSSAALPLGSAGE